MIENDVVWFAMSAPYSKELEAQILLQSYNIESFIPLCYKIIERKDGCKMRKLVPAIHNLIFVKTTNAINLIDGIDGLASGLSSVALLSYGYSFFLSQQYGFAMFAIATFGVLVPFFYYNVFGNAEKGKKIFMGDTGSLTIGIIISILAIKLYNSHETYIDNYDPFALAFSPLIIPCFDVVRVFIHRTRLKMNPFKPDKSHIHHKLLAIGMKQRPAMVTIVSFAIVFTFGNLFLTKYININLLLIDVLIWTIANIWLSQQIKKKNKNVQ